MSEGRPRRLFVGIVPPGVALDHLGRVVDGLRVSHGDGAAERLTARDGWHVTVAFIGEVPLPRLADITAAIASAVGRLSDADLRLRLAGSGTFGTGDRRILWAGVAGDVPVLHHLARALREELGDAGLPTDSREFHPHLTITRPGATIGHDLVAADARILERYQGPLWSVDAIHLVASEPVVTAAGPRSAYTVLASQPL